MGAFILIGPFAVIGFAFSKLATGLAQKLLAWALAAVLCLTIFAAAVSGGAS